MLALLPCAGAANADDTATQLAFEAPRDCPDSEELITAVTIRLGYNPFVASAERHADVTIRRLTTTKLQAILEMRMKTRSQGKRQLESTDCRTLMSSVAAALAFAIDPLAYERPIPASAQTQPASVPQPQPIAASLPMQTPRPRVRVGAGIAGALATAPTPSFGLAIDIGLGWEHVSIALEGKLELPTATGSPGVQSSLAYAAAVVCGHYRFLFGCGRFIAGGLRGAGIGVPDTRAATTFYAAAGIRAGAELKVYGILYIRGYLDFGAVITPTTLRLDDQPIWTTPSVFGAVGLSALLVL